jgi:tetratricopeptide (TPR) repeat protein
LGYCLERLGDQAGGEREVRAALAGYVPGERILRASAEYSLGNWLAHRGPEHAQEALALVESASKPEGVGRMPGVLLALGQAQGAAGQTSTSRATFAELVERLDRGEEPRFPAGIAAELRWVLYGSGCRRRPAGAATGTPPACASAGALADLRTGAEAVQHGRSAEAVEPLRRATRAEPALGVAWTWLGRALIQDRPTEAVAAFEKATAIQGYQDGRGRAGDLLALAMARSRVDPRPGEAHRLAGDAARLLDDELARPGLEATAKLELNFGLGQAFMVAGNGPCAARRLSWVIEDANTPGALKARAQELLTEASRAPLHPTGCFEFELYRPTTLSGVWTRYLEEHSRELKGVPADMNFHPPERYQARVRFTGKVRALSQDQVKVVAGFCTPWPMTRSLPSKPDSSALQEIEVQEDEKSQWLPIQEGLVKPLQAERGGGGPIDLYVIFLGDIRGAPVFLTGEFRVVE